MDFLLKALSAIPAAASHPFSFVAYLFLILAWVVAGRRIKRNKQLLENLEKLPEKDRLSALKAEMGTVSVKTGMTPSEYLSHERQKYIFIAFLSLIAVGLIIFSIAFTQVSKIEKSNAELIKILDNREEKLVGLFDDLLASEKITSSIEFDLIRLSEQTLMGIISQRRQALIDGDQILAHELGNEIDKAASTYFEIIEKFNTRVKEPDVTNEIKALIGQVDKKITVEK